MRHLKLLRWTAALMVAIALAPAAASGQEDGTVTISGVFSMDYFSGESDLNWYLPGLTEVYFNGHEHTWTLTLHGTTQSHYTNYGTEIHATSFDLEFFGPDAATLNGIVSDHLAGGNVGVYLQNTYDDNGGGFATMHVSVSGGDPGVYRGTYFETGQDMGVDTLFPTDADGYPVVRPEPFSIEPDYTELGYFEMFSGTGGYVSSLAGLVTFSLAAAGLAGDFNNDGIVDTADLLKWQGDFGQNADSDADNDNDSDGADFLAWQRQLGSSPNTIGSAAQAPEPSSLGLLLPLTAAAMLMSARRGARPFAFYRRSHIT